MDAFATFQDLGLLLNRTFTPDEQAWITALLEGASTYLRDDVIGQQVYPQTTSTFTAYPDGGRIDLPQSPVVTVVSVTSGGLAVDYTRYDNTLDLTLHAWSSLRTDPVDVTFTYGYATPPESLIRWACVLVSQTLIPLEAGLGLTVGGLSSVALDDFKAAFADAGDSTGTTLSDRNIKLIRDQFGVRNASVVGTR